MTKTHFAPYADGITACGRFDRARTTTNPHCVSCLPCQRSAGFEAARSAWEVSEALSIAHSTPHGVRNPWGNALIACRNCGRGEFLDAGRSLDTFNHICVNCGQMNHTMTETGMSA